MDKQVLAILNIYKKDPLMGRIYATNEILKKYRFSHVSFDFEAAVDGLTAIMSKNTNKYQKKAGRFILNFFFGVKETNNMIEDIAVVADRNDPLVRHWKLKVFKRDNYTCQHCGVTKKLVAHHISHWGDDPVNRVNVDNGITLCSKCHAKEHEADWYHYLVESRI